MGRKSLKEIRVNEILDAFERCLTKKGLQGTTLDNIAEEAGLARRMIRHYIGNRTDLIDAAVERIIEKFTLSVFNALDQFERTERFNGALDYLFSEAFNELPATKLVAALLAVSLYDEQVCRAVKTLYDSFHLGLDHELKTQTPDAPDRQRLQTAYSIMCLSFGGGWMRNIGFDPSLNAQNKIIAQSLIDQLLLVET
ncbi:MAG: AcrR family transcriptional regulator [Pseudohongiellaceae bacterium]|jgi:AcrR family transcriptional regulator